MRHAFHIHNKVKIVKTGYLEKHMQLLMLENDLKTLQSTYNKVTLRYSAIQEYILGKNPIFGPEMYELHNIPRKLRQLYRLIEIVRVSFYDLLHSCERYPLTSN